MKHKTACMLISIVGAAAINANADNRFAFDSSGPGQPNSVMVKDQMVRIEASSPQGKNVSLYDNHDKTFYVLNDRQGSYVEMNGETIESQAQQMKGVQQQMFVRLREQLKNMPPEQRRAAEQQMARMGINPSQPDTAPPEITTQKTDEASTVNGIACTIYKAYVDSTESSRACIASRQALDLSKSDYKTLKDMFSFMREMSEQASSITGTSLASQGQAAFDKIDGLPIQIQAVNGNSLTLTESSGQSLSPDLFTIPDGYTKTQFRVPQAPQQPPARR